MDILTGRPKLLKAANLSLLRKVLKSTETITRAELAARTGISSTTVRALLGELLANREIVSVGYDESSGGRKAERYRYCPERYHSAVFCMDDNEVRFLLIDACGAWKEVEPLDLQGGTIEDAVLRRMDTLVKEREIASIGLGVPGVVEGGSYWKRWPGEEKMCRSDLGETLSRRYAVPVVMENDLNATAVGFGCCYAAQYPGEDPQEVNMAYLKLEFGCVSGGFLSGGQLVRGCGNYAGELSLIPPEDGGRVLPLAAADDVNYLVRVVTWLCAILNPRYVALGGTDVTRRCVALVGEELSVRLPGIMRAELLHAPDAWHDYYTGMARLTAAKLFDEVQLVKE